jgi:uncharacterized protein (TIGR00290 family)
MKTASNSLPALLNWSSGKDSMLALLHVLEDEEYEIHHLLTTVNEAYKRISQHGVRIELLERQVASLGFDLHKVWLPESIDMDTYSSIMREALSGYKNDGIRHVIYGDIFLDRVRSYREQNLSKLDLKGVFPLWKQNTSRLANKFIEAGYKAAVVCVNDQYLDRTFVGRTYDQDFLNDLPGEVDPCGENGEFHTFVWDGPLFKQPVEFNFGEIVRRGIKTGETENNKSSCPPDKTSNSVHTNDRKGGLWFIDLE